MKIEKMISQHRRDFSAEMKCEFCGHTELNEYGYDDRYYHDEVIPNMECKKCKESTISKRGTVDKTPTKYPEEYQI
jgi:hypothetical protein